MSQYLSPGHSDPAAVLIAQKNTVNPGSIADKALVFTRITNKHGPLTKTFTVNKDDPNGAPDRTTDAKLYEGLAETIVCADLIGFRDHIQAAKPDQAFTYGVVKHDRVDIVKKADVDRVPGSIARTREHFHFRQSPGIWMLDHDAGYLPNEYQTSGELRTALLAACPALANAPMLWTSSASSFIHNSNTNHCVKGPGGARIYIPVTDVSETIRAHKALCEYFWAIGLGAYSVSKSGQLIERTLIDRMTAQPERLDFVAGANCEFPLEQRQPSPVLFESETLGGLNRPAF